MDHSRNEMLHVQRTDKWEKLLSGFAGPLKDRPDVKRSIGIAAGFMILCSAPNADWRLLLQILRKLERNARLQVHEILGLIRFERRMIRLADQLPPSRGYRPLLVSHGWNPLIANLMANLVARHGRREAADAALRNEVVQNIRFLSKPRRKTKSLREKIQFLVDCNNNSTVLEPMFLGTNETQLGRLLDEALIVGQTEQLTQYCGELSKNLKQTRGPKPSAASRSHQFLMETGVVKRGYTFRPIDNVCDDAATIATQKEFGLSRFDPRPAHQRSKGKQF